MENIINSIYLCARQSANAVKTTGKCVNLILSAVCQIFSDKTSFSSGFRNGFFFFARHFFVVCLEVKYKFSTLFEFTLVVWKKNESKSFINHDFPAIKNEQN